MKRFNIAQRVLDFASQKRKLLLGRALAVPVQVGTPPEPTHVLPGTKGSLVVARYPLTQTTGDVSVYQRGTSYELVVVSYIHGTLVPFFRLKGRHRKLEVAKKRARKVATTWGKE